MQTRWKSTRYQVGDLVKYTGRTYEVYRIDLLRGPDRHPKPMYSLRARYRVKKVGAGYTYAFTSAANLKKVS
jgi:hypothetical protein